MQTCSLPETLSASDSEGLAAAMKACRPAIVRGLCADWPAVFSAGRSDASLCEYLTALDSGAIAEAFVGKPEIGGCYSYGDGPDGFNFSRQKMNVSTLVSSIVADAGQDDAQSKYMGSIPVDEFLPGFARANEMKLLPPSVQPRIWLGSRSRVGCHFDTFDNLACVVAGRRRFTLFPPEAIAGLYVGPIDHTMAGQPIGLAVGSEPCDPRYPRFEALRGSETVVDLSPGDALYLPKLWWHQVEALDPLNVLVNYWWDAFAAGPDAPFNTMMLAMIAISERPDAERAAWKSYFDHYVFRPNGHPLAHLPEEKHGILGALKNGNYGRVRAFVMQRLRGG